MKTDDKSITAKMICAEFVRPEHIKESDYDEPGTYVTLRLDNPDWPVRAGKHLLTVIEQGDEEAA